jgi:aspartate racemase
MHKLGLIGGTGPESTIPYYHDIVFGVKEKMGTDYFPNMTIESLSVFEVLGKCAAGDYDGLAAYLSQGIANLAAAHCEYAAFTGITPHIVYDEVQHRSSIPIISMVDTTCRRAQQEGYGCVALLETKPTMTGTFFQKPFIAAGIDVAVPKPLEIDYIHEKIETELENGIVREETRQKFIDIIERMEHDDGVDAVVLGCTEIPLLFQKGHPTPIPPLDAMKIHIEALIDTITAE